MAIEKKIINQTHFVHKQDVGANDKCPPQAIIILNTIKGAENKRVERSALIALLSDGRLTTRQTPERVLGFYKPRLIEAGFIAEEKVPIEIEVEVPDKPAKTAKAEGDAGQAEKPEGAAPASVKSKKDVKTVQPAVDVAAESNHDAAAEAKA